MSIPGYGKVWHLNHREAAALRGKQVVVQEKLDGSQFSFGVIDGRLVCRSKNVEIMPGNVQKLFSVAVAHVERIYDETPWLLSEGWVFRGEAFHRPRHNALEYKRMPAGGIVLYDVETSKGHVCEGSLDEIAEMLGVDKAPAHFEGTFEDGVNQEAIAHWLSCDSVLGGLIEGVVIKARDHYDSKDKMLKAKFVREGFKEINKGAQRRANPSSKDVIERLVNRFASKGSCVEGRAAPERGGKDHRGHGGPQAHHSWVPG